MTTTTRVLRTPEWRARVSRDGVELLPAVPILFRTSVECFYAPKCTEPSGMLDDLREQVRCRLDLEVVDAHLRAHSIDIAACNRVAW